MRRGQERGFANRRHRRRHAAGARLSILVVLAGCGGESASGPADLSASGSDLPAPADLGRAVDRPDLTSPEQTDLAAPPDLEPGGDLLPGPDLADPNGWVLDPARPLSAAASPFATIDHPLSPGPLLAAEQAPLPTGALWQSLILGAGDGRVLVLPYTVRARADGVSIGGPHLSTDADSEALLDAAALTLGATETLVRHAVQGHDALSATLSYAGENGAGSLQIPLVQGSPYITGQYLDLTPAIRTAKGVSITSVNGANKSPVTDQRFEVTLDSGETWIVYSPLPITFAWNAAGLAAQIPFAGPVRLALRPSPAAARLLDADWPAVPVGGHLEVEVAGDQATVRLRWQVAGQGPLLMLSLPHHRAAGAPMAAADPAYETCGGLQLPIEGDTLELRYPLSTIAWSPPRPIDPQRKAAVATALAGDLGYTPDPAAADGDPDQGPRQMQALAQLALIADDLGDARSAATLRARLAPLVAAWLDGKNKNPLLYDRTWGGLVTTAGARAAASDGGNGWYAEHPAQYGHLLFAAAVVAHADAAWAARYHDVLTLLVRDIANPANADPLFPAFRGMDFYAGHGWGSGLLPGPDGPIARSSSEAANAWYAIRLLGDAYGDHALTGLGRTLMAMEALAARTYVQVRTASTVYRMPFSAHHLASTLAAGRVQFASGLGASATYSYGAQVRPLSAASEALLDPGWAADASAQLVAAATAHDRVPGWVGYLFEAQAVADKAAAQKSLDALNTFEPATTRTAALHWVATRP